MTLKDVREWLKPLVPGASFYIGKIDASKESVIGIYGRAGSQDSIAVGGLNNTSTATKTISILIHWNKNCDTTECKAKSIYDLLNGRHATIGSYECFFRMKADEPIFVGTDENNIFEYVIDVEIIYKRG